MFRRVSILCLPLMAIASLPVAAIPITQVENKFDCPELDNQQDCAAKAERALIGVHRTEITRTGNALRIRLIKSGSIVFRDNGGSSYNAVDWGNAGRFVALRKQYFEGNDWQLLDRRNGTIKSIRGYPLFSPDGTKFVAATEDLDAGYIRNVLDVYNVTPNGVVRAFRAMPDSGGSWAARDVAWDGEDTIRFQRTTLGEKREIEVPGMLVFRNGRWSLPR